MHGDFPPLDEDIHISIPAKGPGEMQISSLELDTEQQPPEPGDSIQLRGSLESQWLKRYAVDEVFISFQGQPTSTIFIEIVRSTVQSSRFVEIPVENNLKTAFGSFKLTPVLLLPDT